MGQRYVSHDGFAINSRKPKSKYAKRRKKPRKLINIIFSQKTTIILLLQKDRIREIYRRYAEILIRLNCYYSMAVSFDCGESWEEDPEPAVFVQKVLEAPQTAQLRVLFPAQNAMIDLDVGYTDLAVYDPDSNILDLLRPMLLAEGFFLWLGEE